MSNPTSANQQQSSVAQGNKSATVYSYAQQEKLINLQVEIDLLLAQIQSETKLVTAR
jgi:hypothetical protein